MRNRACPVLSERESTARSRGCRSSDVVVGIGLEVTVQEQQRRVNHEKGEGETENKDDTCANTFLT